MGTNAGWPEAFGFSVSGGAPVVIGEVEEGGSAQQAGLQPGDVITQLDGEDVQRWSLEQVISRAQLSVKVPPSLVVISRVRQFRLPRTAEGGYGITLRGNCPVFVRSVDFPSPARQAGVRSGDLLLEVNKKNVRHSSKVDVLELLRGSGGVLVITVIAGGLDWNPLSPETSLTQSRRVRNSAKYQKAADFHSKVRYYLLDDAVKKTHLLTLLRLYARDRGVDSLADSLDVLLDGPIERRLIPCVREFLQPSHRARFDTILSYTPGHAVTTRRDSVTTLGAKPRPLAATRGVPWTSSLPTLTVREGTERLVRVNRGGGGFGFSLSGNAPVFIRSVDTGGAAASAGLQAGDRLLGLNGLNIRSATHSHVVRLLRGSGTSPTLLVSSPHSARDWGERPGSANRRLGGASRKGGVVSPLAAEIRQQSSVFRQKMEEVLLPQEKERVMLELSRFSRQKDIPQLVEGLRMLLSDPTKMVLFHHVCQLLPEEAQAEFDRMAASRLAREEGSEASASLLGSGGAAGASWGPQGEIHLPEGPSKKISSSLFPLPPAMPSGGVLQDTAIGSVGMEDGFGGWREDRGLLGPLEEEEQGEEGGWVREKLPQQQREALRVKRESLEKTPVGQSLSALLTGGASSPQKRCSTEATPPATPTSATMANITYTSTPGTIPPPPPTPEIGAGGVPIPPPPPPSLPTAEPHLKRVNWQKMPKTEGTVWGELSGLDEAIELAELDTQFAMHKSKESGLVKNKKTSILDPKKAYNISILLGHLKLPARAIKQAVLSCDDSVLAEQHLRQMEAFAPDKKECLGFARYYDNLSILSLPDQFSCEMSTIPCYRERLRAMVFRMHYQEKVEEIKPDLEAICQAAVQLKKSKHFKKLLELVLAIGNHMNMGNMRIGQAQGFRIAFLSQLRGLRTTDGKSSLLHFLAGLAQRKFPEVLQFPEDLPCCSQAARVSGQTLEVEVNELSQGLRDIRQDLREISSRDQLPGDRFQEVMSGFLAEAESKMAGLLRLYAHMKQEYSQTVHFFGEDPANMRIDDFFGIFASFITDFERALQENRQARHKAVERERRLEEGGTAGRRRGQASKPRPPQPAEDHYQQFKGELENMRLRPVSQKPHSRTEQRPQTDFTHLLRPARNKVKGHPPQAKPTSPRPSNFDDETLF